jgi:GNAT superfamily N-acetyltransferase
VTANPLIRPATPDDFESLLAIREEVAIDLLERGIQSNPNALTWQHLEEWTSAGVLWVGELNGTVIGSIAVWSYDPTNYWSRGDLASYLRDLMVHPRHRHKGFGAVLLGWAERFSVGRGRSRVRLDCDATNERLCRYYKEAGYRHVVTDNDGFALFEKTLR